MRALHEHGRLMASTVSSSSSSPATFCGAHHYRWMISFSCGWLGPFAFEPIFGLGHHQVVSHDQPPSRPPSFLPRSIAFSAIMMFITYGATEIASRPVFWRVLASFGMSHSGKEEEVEEGKKEMMWPRMLNAWSVDVAGRLAKRSNIQSNLGKRLSPARWMKLSPTKPVAASQWSVDG